MADVIPIPINIPGIKKYPITATRYFNPSTIIAPNSSNAGGSASPSTDFLITLNAYPNSMKIGMIRIENSNDMPSTTTRFRFFEGYPNESLNISPISMSPPLVLFSSQSYKEQIYVGLIVYIFIYRWALHLLPYSWL
jgi:hypothetical protein